MKRHVIIEDLVSGIVGIFVRKEQAPGKEFRYVIYYKEPRPWGFMSKSLKLPGTIPEGGYKEISGTQCHDGYPRILIFSYGDGHQSLIPEIINESIHATLRRHEMVTKNMEQKESSLRAEQRIYERSKEEEIQKIAKMAADIVPDKKRGQHGSSGLELGSAE